MIFRLIVRSKKRFGFIPDDDLRYFNNHFICKPMLENWEIPVARPHGTSYEKCDFVSWMRCAPVISEKAKAIMEEKFQNFIEILPFYQIKKRKYYALNVLSTDKKDPIFKMTCNPFEDIFVSEQFGAVLVDNNLSGVEMVSLDVDLDRKIVLGESANSFPGLLG